MELEKTKTMKTHEIENTGGFMGRQNIAKSTSTFGKNLF